MFETLRVKLNNMDPKVIYYLNKLIVICVKCVYNQ